MRALALFTVAALALGLGLWFTLSGPERTAAAPVESPGQQASAQNPAPLARTPAADERRSQPASEPDEHASADRAPLIEGRTEAHTIVARTVDVDGQPISGAELRLLSAGGPVRNSAPDGVVRLVLAEVPAEEDEFELRVRAHGFATGAVRRAFARGATTWVGDVVLEAGAAIRGRVVDGTGHPVAGAEVRAGPPAAAISEEILALQRRGDLAHIGPLPPGGRARSGPDGRFELSGLSSGHWAIWAGSHAHLWTHGGDLAVQPGVDLEDVELVLERIDPREYIRGRLFDPEGRSVAGRRVDAERPDAWSWDGATTDDQGRFRIHVPDDHPRNVRAAAPHWEWAEVFVEGVVRRPRELELQYRRAEWLWVRVVDEAGKPVVRGRVWGIGLEPDRKRRLPRVVSDLWDDGRARLHMPQESFRLSVEAPGFVERIVGPFEPGARSDPIEIIVERAPAVRGRLSDGGRGLADRSVTLIGELNSERVHHQGGWTGRGEAFDRIGRPVNDAEVKSDPQGRFALPMLDRWKRGKTPRVWVLARLEGRADTLAGPFELDPTLGLEGIELEVPSAASIAGHLQLGDGSPAGWVVRASDGVGTFRSGTADADGAYGIDGLHPGSWQLRAFPPGARFFHLNVTSREGASEIAWDVELRAGGHARFDLEVAERTAVLHGRLTVRAEGFEAGPGSWQAYAQPEGKFMHSDSSPVAPDGSFRLELFEAGAVELRLGSQDPRLQGMILTTPLELAPGRNEWDLELELGWIQGRWTDDVAPAAGSRHVSVVSTLEGGAEVSVRLALDEQGRFGPGLVAAGPGRLVVTQLDMTPPSSSTLKKQTIEREVLVPTEGVLETELP